MAGLLLLSWVAGDARAQGASVLTRPATLIAAAAPTRSCESLQSLELPHTKIDAATRSPCSTRECSKRKRPAW